MKKGHLLIVDDNKDILEAWSLYLQPYFYKIDTLSNPELLIELLSKNNYDLLLLDMNFKLGVNSGNEGLFWLKKILTLHPEQMVVVITAFGDIELAIQAMKLGATDFIQKNWNVSKILSIIKTAFKRKQTEKEISKLKTKKQQPGESPEPDFDLVRGPAKSMQRIYKKIDKVAATDANILLLGENGVGKELVAREIKKRSARKSEMFIPVDLGSITETLFESELFGHMKGAFTGANADKPGRIELACGGTLFLDEIGNLTMDMQSKLLSVLQNHTIYRVGGLKKIEVDFRLISSTNVDLADSIANKLFREDLFYRINTITINIPPLRERKEDIPVLIKHFIKHFTDKYNKKLNISSPALSFLYEYNWPGNIRELKHIIEKGVILSESNEIKLEDVANDSTPNDYHNHKQSFNLENNEITIIRKVLIKCNGNRSKAAKILGINRSTLYEKIKKHSIYPF
ncbi:sigma-54-dependent transcriptional regulator [Bacteroidota bacterium]